MSVIAHNRSTGANFSGFTTSTGSYAVKSLPAAAKGYAICFNPFTATGTGFRPRCYKNVAWTGGPIPSGATAVSVSLGTVHTGIRQTLPRGGAISGVVRNGAGNPINHAVVEVFSSGGTPLGSSTTNAQGHYAVRGLAAAAGDRVCAPPLRASAAITYHGKCWKAVAWNGNHLPSGTNPVSVHLGSTHTGINLKLARTVYSLGSISGTIHENLGSGTLQFADVYLYSNGGAFLDHASSDSSGKYTFAHLRASSTGYVVCVTGQFATATLVSAWGWAPRCYTDTPWNGLAIPGAATRVTLSAGQSRSGIDVTVHVGAAIDGYVYSSVDNSVPAQGGMPVSAYTAGGRLVGTAYSDSTTGEYTLTGLSPGSYIVCFDGRYDVFGGSPTGYLPQCFDGVTWDGSG